MPEYIVTIQNFDGEKRRTRKVPVIAATVSEAESYVSLEEGDTVMDTTRGFSGMEDMKFISRKQ